MSIEQINALRDERARLATEMRDLVERVESESADSERETAGFTSDEDEKWERMTGGIENLDKRIERMQKSMSVFADLDEYVDHVNSKREGKRPALPGRDDGRADGGRGDSDEQRYSKAFNMWMRGGMSGLDSEQRALMRTMRPVGEQRANQSTTAAEGGYTVAEEWNNTITEALKDFSGVRNIANVINTSTGADLHFPTQDSTAEKGAILAEAIEDAADDYVFAETVLEDYKYTSKIVRVSEELLQDSMFDLNVWLGAKLGERIGRAQAEHYAVGTGSGQPNGVMVAASTVAAAAAGAIAWDDLVNLKHGVDPAYRRRGPQWLFNDTTLKAIKLLKDSSGLPLWQPNVMMGEPPTIDGDPYTVDSDVADIGATNESVAYGDFSTYYIRDIRGINVKRLVERYAEFHQVGFIAFARTDADLIDGGGGSIKALSHPA